jgi:hypothetical protein
VLPPSSGMNYFTRQYIPEDNSELHTRHRENLKSHKITEVAMSELEVKIHRNKGATRHPRRCNGTNGNGKEAETRGGNERQYFQ